MKLLREGARLVWIGTPADRTELRVGDALVLTHPDGSTRHGVVAADADNRLVLRSDGPEGDIDLATDMDAERVPA